jgi:hypothetical protein
VRARRIGVALRSSLTLAVVLFARTATAEVILGKSDGGFEFFSEGRVGGFVEQVTGDTLPTAFDASGNMIHTIGDGGVGVSGVYRTLPMGAIGQGDVQGSRVRSGFLSNVLAFGLRRNLTPTTLVTGYIAIWAPIESENERKFVPVFPDAREGYVRVDGPAGRLLVGRTLTLFSRGATEINFLYGHRYGVGSPAGFDTQGPSGGHVGYGVIANGFGAGIAYATPSFHGLMLTAGYYDPNRFVGFYWVRTKLGRPEAELTYDFAVGDRVRGHLFLNGAFQKIYANDSERSSSVWGGGAGGRVEFSILRLGVAGHYGQGLGFDYAFDGSNAVVEIARSQELRKFDGAYIQTQVVLGRTDVGVGAGVTRVHQVAADEIPDPATGQIPTSVLKQRIGVSAVVVYHFSDYLHFDFDYFRASAEWWLGEKQVVHTFNSGLTLTW